MKFVQHRLDQTRRIYSLSDDVIRVRDGSPIPKPIATPESINPIALATLLYSGAVLPPDTIWKNHYAIGAGGTLSANDGIIDYQEADDLFENSAVVNEPFDPIDLLAASMDGSDVDLCQCKLLLSEGKDSIGIAIALAELGQQIDCVHFANADSNVDLVRAVAKRFGHRLEVIRYTDLTIIDSNWQSLSKVFEPTVDQAMLSYLLLPTDVFEGSVIIDGMGNDFYMGHLPTPEQLKATRYCQLATKAIPRWLRDKLKGKLFPNRAYCGIPLRTFSECQGLYNGFDCTVLEETIAEPRLLDKIDATWKKYGYQKGRALSRGRYLDTYSFSGKSIALAEMSSAKVYFPWADTKIAEQYEHQTPESLYDWPTVNKLPLRSAINKRFKYQQPKVGFRAPVAEILSSNSILFERAISRSNLIPDALKRDARSPSPYRNRAVACYLIALWELASLDA